jgi:hypothetical protein
LGEAAIPEDAEFAGDKENPEDSDDDIPPDDDISADIRSDKIRDSTASIPPWLENRFIPGGACSVYWFAPS